MISAKALVTQIEQMNVEQAWTKEAVWSPVHYCERKVKTGGKSGKSTWLSKDVVERLKTGDSKDFITQE